MTVLWKTQVDSTPIVVAPLFEDVNGDGKKDIVIASAGGLIDVLNVADGKSLPNSHWPTLLGHANILSSPILVSAFLWMYTSKIQYSF